MVHETQGQGRTISLAGRESAVDFEEAHSWVRAYLRSEPGRFAYPVYDGFDDTNANDDRITDGDLLAPALLNAPVSIPAFAGLQAVRGDLERVVELPADLDLADASDEVVGGIADLYAVLDTDRRPKGVRGTILSKILHRKRPRLVPLYDANVFEVYAAPSGPIPPATNRTWVEYMGLLTSAVREDLRKAQSSWRELAALAPKGRPSVSELRVLDIVAWRLGGRLRVPDAGGNAL